MARRMYRGNTAATSLAGPVTNSATTFTVVTNGGATYPDGSTGSFVVTLDYGASSGEEKVLCSARSGDVFTVASRGYDNTAATAHAAGAAVRHTISAVDLDEPNAHINDATRDDHTQYAKRGQGLAANVGAASRAGRFYIATDSEDLYADDATTVHRYLSKPSADAAYVLTAGGSTVSPAAAVKGLVVKQAAAPTVNAFEVQPNGSTTPIFAVSSGGTLTQTGKMVLLGMTTLSAAAGGAASALPAAPAGYVVISINGSDRTIPYYS